MVFRIIGQYEISRDGDIIRALSTPEFNLEAARSYALAMMEMIKQMPPRFGVLVSFEAPPIIGPDVEESMRESARERASMGMVAAAFVTANQDGIGLARVQWQRIYEGSGIAWEFFDEDAKAQAWLRERIGKARGAS